MKGEQKKTKKRNRENRECITGAYLSSAWVAEADVLLSDTEIPAWPQNYRWEDFAANQKKDLKPNDKNLK